MGWGTGNIGGGGASLNFKVVGGTTAPTNPSENTIWVNTDQKINGWYLTATQPENPAAGAVWVLTGASSQVAFNVLKKNAITVYPISVKQYISGAWVDKTAKSYQGGAWVDWKVFFFNNGDECTAITGGWRGVLGSTSALSKGTFTSADGVIELSVTGNQAIWATTENMIDLSDYDKLVLVVESRGSGGTCYFGVTQKETFNSNADMAASISVGASTTGAVELDISGLDSGEYYVCVRMASSTSGTRGVSFSEVYPE